MKPGVAVAIKPFDRTELYDRLLEEHRVIATKLRLPHKIKLKSIKLLRKAVKFRVVSRRKPRSVAAACIYGATVLEGATIHQSEIADAAGVFGVTIWRV